MRTKLIYSIVALSFFIACNSKTTTKDIATATDTSVNADTTQQLIILPAELCYHSIKNKDTIDLHLIVKSDTVSGTLNYNIFEKDKNKGMLNGVMKGDTIYADYTFMSEGVKSVREIAFLKKGEDLYEGFGDVEEKNGKMSFKNKGSLSFDTALVLSPYDCLAK